MYRYSIAYVLVLVLRHTVDRVKKLFRWYAIKPPAYTMTQLHTLSVRPTTVKIVPPHNEYQSSIVERWTMNNHHHLDLTFFLGHSSAVIVSNKSPVGLLASLD